MTFGRICLLLVACADTFYSCLCCTATGGILNTAEQRAAKGLPNPTKSTSELKSDGGTLQFIMLSIFDYVDLISSLRVM